MIRSSREEETSAKQELVIRSNEKVQIMSSRAWSSALKNPRIVRVGRAFGGKDRHSKVTTVRGLRDRRIRLSVPTAIQLYDLQDKLGLSQPSKVVDWLLNAAQHEIDKLPPLRMPPESFMQFPHQPRATARRKAATAEASDFFNGSRSAQQLATFSANLATAAAASTIVGEGQSVLSKSTIWNSNALMDIKGKEFMREAAGGGIEKSSSGLMMNNAMSHGAYYQLEPSNSISLMSHLSAADGHHLIPKQYSHFQMIHLGAESFHDPNPLRIAQQQQSADSSNFLVLQPNYIFRSHGQDQGQN